MNPNAPEFVPRSTSQHHSQAHSQAQTLLYQLQVQQYYQQLDEGDRWTGQTSSTRQSKSGSAASNMTQQKIHDAVTANQSNYNFISIITDSKHSEDKIDDNFETQDGFVSAFNLTQNSTVQGSEQEVSCLVVGNTPNVVSLWAKVIVEANTEDDHDTASKVLFHASDLNGCCVPGVVTKLSSTFVPPQNTATNTNNMNDTKFRMGIEDVLFLNNLDFVAGRNPNESPIKAAIIPSTSDLTKVVFFC